MGKVKRDVKGVLNQRVRVGIFTVPLWLLGLYFAFRWLRDRRQLGVYAR